MRPSHRKHNRSWTPGPKAWARRRHRTWPAHFGCGDILPRGGEKLMEVPRWARLAWDRHWIGADAYAAVKPEWLGRMTVGFDDIPLMRMIKRGGW